MSLDRAALSLVVSVIIPELFCLISFPCVGSLKLRYDESPRASCVWLVTSEASTATHACRAVDNVFAG